MVYGRYNELVHGGFVMVYKPTNITGGAHPVRIWRFVKMSVPGFVDKSQFHACCLMFAFKKHDLPWWGENVEILRYLWKSF